MAKLEDLPIESESWKPFSVTRASENGKPAAVFDVKIRVLSPHEMDSARVNAAAHIARLEKEGAPLGTDREPMLERSRIVEILSSALMDPESDPSKPDSWMPWSGTEILRRRLREPELMAFWHAYCAFQSETSPICQDMTVERYESVLDDLLLENGPHRFLNGYTRAAQVDFLRAMAAEIHSLRSEKSTWGRSEETGGDAGIEQAVASPDW